MPAGQDLIFFDSPEDWVTIVNTTRRAVKKGENSHIPIPGFDLGVSLNEEYVAVVAGTTQGKPNWFFAGDITQVYSFSPGRGNSILGKIQPPRARLAINRLQLIETNRISTDNFRLKYTPPTWFKDCSIRVYKYIGDKLNFVEDTLFDIGNALGIDPSSPEGKIALGFAALRDDIDQNFTELNNRIDEDIDSEEQQEQELSRRLSQMNAGIYTLAEGISQLLPASEANDLTQNVQTRLDLDLGFL